MNSNQTSLNQVWWHACIAITSLAAAIHDIWNCLKMRLSYHVKRTALLPHNATTHSTPVPVPSSKTPHPHAHGPSKLEFPSPWLHTKHPGEATGSGPWHETCMKLPWNLSRETQGQNRKAAVKHRRASNHCAAMAVVRHSVPKMAPKHSLLQRSVSKLAGSQKSLKHQTEIMVWASGSLRADKIRCI